MRFSFKSNTFKYLIPREHGAWAMWVAPFILGTIMFGFSMDVAVFGLAALLLFITYSPAAQAIKSNRNQDSLFTAIVIGAALFIISACFLISRCFSWMLIALSGVCFMLMSVHLLSQVYRKNMTLTVHMLGIAGLTMTAPIVGVINTGEFSAITAWLWIINFFYFVTTTFYIRLRIRIQSKMREKMSVGKKLKIGSPAIISSLFPVGFVMVLDHPEFAIPFIPGILKALWGSLFFQPGKRSKPVVLGITEIAFTVVFIWLASIVFIN